jgi:hypothetical protein
MTVIAFPKQNKRLCRPAVLIRERELRSVRQAMRQCAIHGLSFLGLSIMSGGLCAAIYTTRGIADPVLAVMSGAFLGLAGAFLALGRREWQDRCQLSGDYRRAQGTGEDSLRRAVS